MGYDLRALIARRDVLAAHKQDFGSVHVVGLRQGFALIPLTEQLVAEICGGDAPRDDRPLTSGEELPWQLTSWIHFISQAGAVVYVEDNCWGGGCKQASAIWVNGQIVLGPLLDQKTQGSPETWPVNHALQAIGIQREWAFDQFDALMLGGSIRSTEDWTRVRDLDAPDLAIRFVAERIPGPRGARLWLDEPIAVAFREERDVIAALKHADNDITSVDLGIGSPLRVPVRLTVDGVDFFGTRDDSWRLLPPVQLAVAGLESIRWATCGALARLPVTGGERINLHVNASIAYLSFAPSRRSAVVLFPALLAAWEGFARQLHGRLLNQLPELRDHRVYSWFRGDPLAFDPAFRPPPIWPTA